MTKKERHKAYTMCLIDIENANKCFCCSSFKANGFLNEIDQAKFCFPELYRLKTHISEKMWFISREERIKALNKCIELTK